MNDLLNWLFGRKRADEEVREEIEGHIAMRTQMNRDSGMPNDEARVEAAKQFGNATSIREEIYQSGGFGFLDSIAQDLRYALRSLAKHKEFAATAFLTLALGIGATTAIFSVVSGVVLRPLPFAEPGRLVQLYGTPASRGEAVDNLPAFRDESQSFEMLAGYSVSARYLRGSAGSERVMTVSAERGLFSMLGVGPMIGRAFESDDPASVAIMSEGFWRRQFGGDRSVIGMPVTLDGEPFTIIGVMPEKFQFPYGAASVLAGVASQARTDLWMPLDPPPDPVLRARSRSAYVIGRLKPNVSLDAVQSELSAIAARLQSERPDPYGARGVRVVPLSEAVVAAPVRRILFILFGAVGIVLVLACANVTHLSLTRMSIRSREITVRAAIGASPFRILRQLLTESLLLSFAGGLAGLVVAFVGAKQLMLAAAAQLPRANEVGVDWRVFLFLLAACVLTGTVSGVAPAFFVVRKDAQSALRESSAHSTMAVGQRRLRDALVIAEVALAFILAVGATLLLRELARLRNVDSGMVTKNVVTFHIGHRMTSRGRERPFESDVRPFYEIADRVAQLRGVRAAGLTQLLPLQNWGWGSNSSDFRVRGRAPISPTFTIELRYITPSYFEALGIPIKKGRGFTVADDRGAPGVILINEALARRYFGSEDPIGKDTTRGLIVGVVGDVRQVHLDRPDSPEIYYPIAQNWSQVSELGLSLVVSTRDNPEPMIGAVRSVVREVNPDLAIFNIKTMDRVVADSLADFTLYLMLMAAFAVLAQVLALTGAYGVISYIVASRAREFAIRAAMGADTGRIMRLILGQGIRLTAMGLGLGLCGALAATPLLQDLPVNIRRPGVVTTAPVAVFVGIVAMAACVLPARRAAGVDPTTVLRDQ